MNINKKGLEAATAWINEAWDKTSPYLIQDAIAAYLPHHESELVKAVEQTLEENGHLADGDNCTLFILKQALARYKGEV